MALFCFFRLFAGRFFVFSFFFSHGVFYFVFSSFRVTSFRREKTQWHKPATIHCRVRDSGERIPVILHLHRPSNAGKMSGFSLLDKNSSGRKTEETAPNSMFFPQYGAYSLGIKPGFFGSGSVIC